VSQNPREIQAKEQSQRVVDIRLPRIFHLSHIDTVAARYDQIVRTILPFSAPGAAVVIVQDTNVILLRGYGVTEHGTQDSVNINTAFRLASVSKGFAGVLTGILSADSTIRLDNPVKKYLKDLELRDPVRTEEITVRNLLNHTTGLVPHAFDNLIEGGIRFDDIIPRLREVSICCPPGTNYGYQNVTFSLIEKVIEEAQPDSYEDLIRSRVFEPLGMWDASADYNSFVTSENTARPHVRYGDGWIPVKVDRDYYEIVPAAGINASARDMSRWLMALLGNQPDVVPTEALDMAFDPGINTPLRYSYTKYWRYLEGKFYGLGWRVYDYNGRKIAYHGGYVRGFRAEIGVSREDDLAIAVMTNSLNRFVNLSIPLFFNMYYNLEDPRITSALAAYINNYEALDTVDIPVGN